MCSSDLVSVYAMRDINQLINDAAAHGTAVGEIAGRVLDHPLPWTTMRRVSRLIGFCRTYGDERVNQACARLLEAESCDLNVLRRMLERALEADTTKTAPAPSNVIIATARFARDNARYAARRNSETQP